ncbi:MAG: ParB/RepB/Spo0J family partition protein [Thiotrichales bacterium]
MVQKKPGLGRGLDALLSAASGLREQPKEGTMLRDLAVEKIHRGQYQPRTHIDPGALEELAESIRAQGVVQPIVVRPIADGYELVAGERRWRAAQLAGLKEIPAIIRDIPDQAAAAMALIENIQRENLNPLEEANALQRLIHEFGMTHQQAAESVGRSRVAVTNLLRLRDLEEPTRQLLETGKLEMGHARALLALSGSQQIQAAQHVAAKGLTVRETERYVNFLKAERNVEAKQNRPRSPDLIRLETDLADRLGAKVEIQYNQQGKGKLVINYNDLDELDGILAHIK